MARKSKALQAAERGEGIHKHECFRAETWDWSTFRIPDAYVQVDPIGWTTKQGKEVPSRTLGAPNGHRCPNCTTGELAWGNGGPFIWSSYVMWCPSCFGGWHAPHKYIFKLIQAELAKRGVEAVDNLPEVVENGDDEDEETSVDESNDADLQPAIIEKKPRKPRAKKAL